MPSPRAVLPPLRRLHSTTTARQAHEQLYNNAFITHVSPPDPSNTNPTGPLSDLPVAVKDNIATLSPHPTTCASRILAGYTSPFEAECVSLLRAAGAPLAGKTNMDEFGMGSHSTHSAAGAVRNALDPRLSAGGSSGGSAVAVALGACEAALGTDTGGSVRLPAAYNGVVGFKPSYGRVSRWGVVAYANSLDTVGVLARRVETVRRVFSVLDVPSARDPTSLSAATRRRIEEAVSARRRTDRLLRVGVPEECNVRELAPVVRRAWSRTLAALRERGHDVVPVSLPTTRQALSAYYIIAPSEASSNLAKYDGVRYGSTLPREEQKGQLFAATRGHGFGQEVKRRILLGAYSLSAEAMDNYFIQAQKIRRLVQRDFDSVFSLPNVLVDHETSDDQPIPSQRETGVDVLVCPTAPTLPPTLEESKSQNPLDAYSDDVFTVPASLAGLPAMSVPVSVDDGLDSPNPQTYRVGMQAIAQYGDDEGVLALAELLGTLDN